MEVITEIKIVKPKPIKKKEYNNTPEYNKAYYEKNKSNINKALQTKCECGECGRTVSYQRLNLHKLSSLCISRRKSTEVDELKEQIQELNRLLNHQA